MIKRNIILTVLFSLLLSLSVQSQELKFKDITAQAGLSVVDRLGGHGTACGDLNNDGWIDFVITNSYNPQFVYINQKNGKFSLTKIENHYLSHQALLVDVDNDGDLDFVIANAGNGEPSKLYLNNGSGQFTFKNSALKTSPGGTRGTTASDFNKDGYLDLYTVNFLFPNQLFINHEGNYFSEEAENWDIQDKETNKAGSQGVVSVDINNDKLPDIFVCKYKYNTTINQKPLLYINHGTYFINEVQKRNINIENLNGATFADLDNDGDLDLILAKQSSNDYLTIYKNNHGYFQNMTNVLKIPLIHKPIFSIITADLNNDGLEDIFVVGWYSTNRLFINKGNWHFESINASIEDYYMNGRSGSFIDYDNDGDLDILITGYIEHTRLYENLYSGNNKSIQLDIFAPNGQKSPFDSIVYLYKNSYAYGTPWQTKHLISTQGYLSQPSTRMHFGVAQEKNLSCKIEYNTGEVKYLFNIQPEAILSVGNVPDIQISNTEKIYDRGFLIKRVIDKIDISITATQPVNKIYVFRKRTDEDSSNYKFIKEFNGNTNSLLIESDENSYDYAIYYTTESSQSFVKFASVLKR